MHLHHAPARCARPRACTPLLLAAQLSVSGSSGTCCKHICVAHPPADLPHRPARPPARLQLFIFYTIQQYGALHFALIMTIRQFLSIVLSCIVFSHKLSATQW